MLTLIAGLVIFIAIHLVPTLPGQRDALVGRLGAGGYKGVFSLLSLVGLVLIVVGYGQASLTAANVAVWQPPAWTRHLALLLMLLASISLVAAYVPSRIRDRLKHPMLLAVKLWALSHLLVRGDLASMLIFGVFLAYAVYDRISVKKRQAMGPLGNRHGKAVNDVIVLAGGVALYGLIVMWFHPQIIGYALIPA